MAYTTRDDIQALTHNEEEVAHVQQLFGGECFLGRDASKKNFPDYAQGARIIHLSAHAFAEGKETTEAGLVFVGEEKKNYEYLGMQELYGLKLQADLAVLSACETGYGDYLRGVGVMSLGRAFRYAGCSSLVMSRWKADDESTARLIKSSFT